MMIRIAIGISQPAGRSLTFSEKGRSFWAQTSTNTSQCTEVESQTHLNDLIMAYGYHDCRDTDQYKEYVPR